MTARLGEANKQVQPLLRVGEGGHRGGQIVGLKMADREHREAACEVSKGVIDTEHKTLCTPTSLDRE